MNKTLFKGNWLVNYDPDQVKYPEILLTLAKIQDHFEKRAIKFDSINIIFNKKGQKNQYSKENGAIFLNFSGIDGEYIEISGKKWEKAVLKPLDKPVKSISLLFPKLENDPRWRTIGITSGQLFLSSSLSAAGFAVTPGLLPLTGQNRPSEAFSADMTGVSMFEDLLPLLRPFLADFRAFYRGILAAGGPFPTLAPMPALFHLPQVNLFVRGEAELVLPKVLEALNEGDADKFFSLEGVFWQRPGLIAMAGFDKVNRPEDLSSLPCDLGFLRRGHLEHGLEMNFSRGCARGCLFCCHAQGRKLRKLPLEKAEKLLKAYKDKINCFPDIRRGVPLERPDGVITEISGRPAGSPLRPVCISDIPVSELPFRDMPGRPAGSPLRPIRISLNINDDDILQDPAYARDIFSLIKKQGFRIFGVQTSTASLIVGDGNPNREVLNLVSDRELYIEERLLLWLGTDAFLPSRARRLGKKLPPVGKFRGLLEELERRKLRHFHYWISSDGESTWGEFVEEFALIISFFEDFPGFGLLAHAPFVVPYPASALFARLEPNDPRLKLKLNLEAPDPRFGYQVVERMETSWPQLNALLRNERAGGEKGFCDLLKEKNMIAAAQLAYFYLKQEILLNFEKKQELIAARENIEELLGGMLKMKIEINAQKVKGKRKKDKGKS